jgi:hypothetical protein
MPLVQITCKNLSLFGWNATCLRVYRLENWQEAKMKYLVVIALMALSTGPLAAQKTQDPGLRHLRAASRPNAMDYKSMSPDTAALVTRNKSTAASDLAKIEQGSNRIQSHHAAAHPAPGTVPKVDTSLGKNKPIRATYRPPQAAGHSGGIRSH